jgi:4-hydroxythreonine-4-phosphate dehydrogenase
MPRLLLTMGDAAGIGPEILAKAWPHLRAGCEIVGDPRFLPTGIPATNASDVKLSHIKIGRVSAEAGRAAYDWLIYAIDECLSGRADGIVTCPLHKEGLHAAGVPHPGHTEILADRCGVQKHAMLLFDETLRLAVAHVTLHESLHSAVDKIRRDAIFEKIQLLQEIVPRLLSEPARIAVGALNPHAGDGGLFGREEIDEIAPAVAHAVQLGIDCRGPFPPDAIFLPERRKLYNGIVAMVHDHGHIPMKLLGGRRAVNVTAGLPIVRTSVAHGTAYDIAGQGIADPSSLLSAVRVARKLAGWIEMLNGE